MSGVFLMALLGGFAGAEQGWFELPKPPPPALYGNILIIKNAAKFDIPTVTFSHWRHRLRFTCRVCHFELGFEMKANTTEITKEKLLNSEYCGACHDGKTAFGQKECNKCHNGDIASGVEKFAALERLPKDNYGNQIDWVQALRQGFIKPKKSLFDANYVSIPFKRFLKIESEWPLVPPAVFPHRAHTEWLDCANCHPDIFNIKKKTTKHFTMLNMLDGKFCGVCHLNVAFPLDDCKRCHPEIRSQ
ncbi:MAG: c(7)-type cytochrome triheme domain-containing protein [bacterium]